MDEYDEPNTTRPHHPALRAEEAFDNSKESLVQHQHTAGGGDYQVIVGPRKFDAQADYLGRALWKYPSWLVYITASLTMISGVYAAMAFKWQTKMDAPTCKSCDTVPFQGALLQAQLMFFAEALGIVAWYIDDSESRKVLRAPLFEFILAETELTRKRTHWHWWPLASVMDCAATVLFNLANYYTYVSVVQMLRNFMIVLASFLQLIMVRKAMKVHEWIGVLLITISLVLTAIPAFGEPEDAHSSGQVALGVIMAVIATCINALQLLWEEWILRRGRYPSMKAVGVEGLSGLLLTLLMWGPYQKLNVEQVTQSWYQQTHSGAISAVSATYIPAGFIFNVAGIATTKLGSGVFRGVCFAGRSVIIWIVSLIVKWQDYDNWNMASMILFIIAFAIYLNEVPYLKKARWFRKPIHFCCTDPALDEGLPGQHEKFLDQASKEP